ncbi:GGDEF domain-containing protein [Actinoplanes sp. LDG1-06]|uniref:GGDEF domain-containing protein n=1 Tax=Paractinoplanes ovalisporus TaxID=2810368 RepID=A0ABS2A5E4_9ACTN|nr:GGDEF domain-containing protein [Actinoplanes ovalisporus]MBM2615017.1 GGDEF domain-containing protein [Actinoplanes ovalisporus]
MQVGDAVGVLAPFVGGIYYGSLIAGVSTAAQQRGHRLIAVQTSSAAADLAVSGGDPAFDAPVGWDHIGGFVVFADAVDRSHLERAMRTGRPVVLVGHSIAGLETSTVLADNAAGMRAAVEHLITEHGCRRLAFTGFLEASDIRERYDAYRAALDAHGLEPGPLLPTANNVESGITWTADDFTRGEPDALVAATDLNGIGAQRLLARAGLRCPEDYLLTGFDNIDLASFVRPEVASVEQPLDAMSRYAVDLVLRQMRGEKLPPVVHRLPARFVARTSCGCTGFAEKLQALDVEDERQRLGRRLGTVAPLESSRSGWVTETVNRATTTTADGLLAVAAGDSSGVMPAVEALRALLEANLNQETLRVICRSVQEYAGALGTGDPDSVRRVDRAVLDIVMMLGRANNHAQLGNQLHLRSLISSSYALSAALLHRRDADPRDPSWLALTPAMAGSIALRGPDGQLRRTPGWRRRPGPPIPEGPTTIEAFPPPEVLNAAGLEHTTFVVRAKVGDSDRGWLALVDRVENRVEDGRELVNQCAALLTIALDLRDQEEHLRRAAHSDLLTGLPNRSSFAVSVRAAIERSQASGHPFVVLFLDLDGFKRVNDSLGHHIGDELLAHVADRIRHCLRHVDVAARFGGDEFLVLLDGVTQGPELDELIERIRAAISRPYLLSGRTARVGVSIGWAEGGATATLERLLQDADAAMYRVKAAGRAPVQAAG